MGKCVKKHSKKFQSKHGLTHLHLHLRKPVQMKRKVIVVLFLFNFMVTWLSYILKNLLKVTLVAFKRNGRIREHTLKELKEHYIYLFLG